MAQNIGHVVQIIGPVLDIKFTPNNLPALYNAIEITRENGEKLVVEVAQHLGDDVVRCIAMSATDGLVRGIEAVDTGAPISVPVGTRRRRVQRCGTRPAVPTWPPRWNCPPSG